MPRKRVQEAAAELSPITPRDVLARWDAEGAPVEKRIARAQSSLSWYRRALKTKGLRPATRTAYELQAALYEEILAGLRAQRDVAKEAAA